MLSIDIRKTVGTFALSVRLDVPPGVTALFGRSGSGKSLTLQCVAGLVAPDAGSIRLGDRTLFAAGQVNLPPQARSVGYVFQQYALFPHLTVAENVAYGLHGLPAAQRQERVRAAVRSVRLTEMEDRFPSQVSGGQAQRVALARALATQPRVLLLDEPFAALDSLVRLELHHELQTLLRELAIPTLLVTHDLEEAYALSRHLAVLDQGCIRQCGQREDVYYRPASRTVAELVGMQNLLPGTVVAGSIRGPGYELPAPPGLPDGARVECGIRPEHVMMLRTAAESEGRGPGALLSGRIVEEVDYGSRVLLWMALDGPAADLGRLAVSLPNYIYDRLAVSQRKEWRLQIKPQFVQVLPAPGGG